MFDGGCRGATPSACSLRCITSESSRAAKILRNAGCPNPQRVDSQTGVEIGRLTSLNSCSAFCANAFDFVRVHRSPSAVKQRGIAICVGQGWSLGKRSRPVLRTGLIAKNGSGNPTCSAVTPCASCAESGACSPQTAAAATRRRSSCSPRAREFRKPARRRQNSCPSLHTNLMFRHRHPNTKLKRCRRVRATGTAHLLPLAEIRSRLRSMRASMRSQVPSPYKLGGPFRKN